MTFDMIVGFAAGMVLCFICLLPALLVAVSAWGRWRRRAWIMRNERDEILAELAEQRPKPYDAPPVPR